MDPLDQSLPDTGEPDANADPVAAQEMTAIAQDRLEALGISLAGRRDEWVQARQASGVEKRWIEDLNQYLGQDDSTKQTATMMESAEAGYPILNKGAKPQRSTVFVNITRPKTNTAEARLANMLLPTDDRNFGLKPSPVPELVRAAKMQAEQQAQAAIAASKQGPPGAAPMQNQPQPGAPGMPPPSAPTPVAQGIAQAYPGPDAQAQLEAATQCAKAMQDEIDDQLQECGYNGESRRMIHEAAVVGTGVIKGPIIVNRTSKSWTPMSDGTSTVHVLEIEVERKPASHCVSPWNVYPDPSCGDDAHAGQGIFEKIAYTSKQLRELVKQPGYIKANIGKILEDGPQYPDHLTERDKKELRGKSTFPYDCWEYWGEFDPEDLRAAGVDVPDGSTELLSGCVIFINDTVIKAFLNPSETGDLPYDFFVWEPDSDSVWGYGVPFLCRPAQKVLNAAWRQLMDNTGLSVGPQIVVNRNAVTPADTRWEITGRKLWYLTDMSITDIRQVFMSVEFNNHGEEIQQIIDLALKFVDIETSVPQLEQGEHANAPETLGGMIIQQNSTNIVLGRLTKTYDDRITAPHIGRYVDWNMAYNPKPEIKGDHQIQARGTSALLVRDLQNQALLNLGQYVGNGVISPMVNWEEWFKACLKAQHIDPTDIMKTDAEIATAGAQQPQATPEQIKANAMLQVAQERGKASLMVAQAKVGGELEYAHREQQISAQNAQAKMQELQMTRDLALLNYSMKHNLTLEQVKADLAKTTMQEETKRQLAAAEIQMRQNEGHRDRVHETLNQPIDTIQ